MKKRFSEEFIVKPGKKVKLQDHDPEFCGHLKKEEAQAQLDQSLKRLGELEYLLYAESKRSVLMVLQAMDAAGKDGTIRTVAGAMNPQSCKVVSFKGPSEEELAHDFLWRVHKATPRKGEITIFNRSHYEDVLIVRVHDLVPRAVWSERYDHINAFERLLSDSNVTVVKFFLHISKDEQLKRFRERQLDPTRQWKFNPADFEERKYWNDYQRAYETAMAKCSTSRAPWYVIPANRKWFRNLAVAQILVETLERLDMKFPEPPADLSAPLAK